MSVVEHHGTWSGHVLPGSLFIFFAIVWAIKTSYRYFFTGVLHETPKKCQRLKWDIIEATIFIILAVCGPWFHLTESDTGEFRRPQNWSHATMYAFFGIYGIASILVIKLPKSMPHCLHHMTMALAFAVEGYLFYFHTHGRKELDVRIHTLLIFAIWPTSVAFVILCFLDNNENVASGYMIFPQTILNSNSMGATDSMSLLQSEGGTKRDIEGISSSHQCSTESISLDDRTGSEWKASKIIEMNHKSDMEKQISSHRKIFTIQFGTAILTMVHGTWFWQAAYVLYPPHGEPWDPESPKNMMFLTIFFAWHVLLAMLIVGAIFAFFRNGRKHKAMDSRHYTALQS